MTLGINPALRVSDVDDMPEWESDNLYICEV